MSTLHQHGSTAESAQLPRRFLHSLHSVFHRSSEQQLRLDLIGFLHTYFGEIRRN